MPGPSEYEANAVYDRALADRRAKRTAAAYKRARAKAGGGVSRLIPARDREGQVINTRESDAELEARLGEWGGVGVQARATYRDEVALRVAERTRPAVEEKMKGAETDYATKARARRIAKQWENLGLSTDEIGQIDDLDFDEIREEAGYQVATQGADQAAVRYN